MHGAGGARSAVTKPAPSTLAAEAGSGTSRCSHVGLVWPRRGRGRLSAASRSVAPPDGPWTRRSTTTHAPDVLAHPGPRYADTTGEPGPSSAGTRSRRWREPTPRAGPPALGRGRARPRTTNPPQPCLHPATIDLHGDAAGELQRVWRVMIGSERLSQLYTPPPGGVGRGVRRSPPASPATSWAPTRVRAPRDLPRRPRRLPFPYGAEHDFSMVDAVYDRVLELGLRPVVELSFMPRELAEDPEATVFEYGAGISVPHDWEGVGAAPVRRARRPPRQALRHRRGPPRWGFEVWNEANLEVFWTGTRDDYFRLYDLSARGGRQGRRRAAARRRSRDRRRRVDPRFSRPCGVSPDRRWTS